MAAAFKRGGEYLSGGAALGAARHGSARLGPPPPATILALIQLNASETLLVGLAGVVVLLLVGRTKASRRNTATFWRCAGPDWAAPR